MAGTKRTSSCCWRPATMSASRCGDALRRGRRGATLAGLSLRAKTRSRRAYPVALNDIAAEQDVEQLGMLIAITRKVIARGHLVHVQRVMSR